MRRNSIIKIIGMLLMIFSITMIPSILVALFYQEPEWRAFSSALALILLLGLMLWLPTRNSGADLPLRDGFLVVALFWLVLGVTGAVPFMLSEHPNMPFTDGLFESISGLTTTGATVLSGLDEMPRSLLFYRQQLQWLGGMGIIVLAVAILPMLGVGGMQLYRAETPGPIKDHKLTPRIAETAKTLWTIYLGITVACALSYWAAGMTLFDAIAHAFSTVSTGGYSTHDASLGYFKSTAIDASACIFMIVSGVNFSIHFSAFRVRGIKGYRRDAETRAYFLIMVVVIVIVCAHLAVKSAVADIGKPIIEGIFQVVSFMTTTGFTTAEYHAWPGFLPVLLVLIGFLGGCGGSTAGGIKVIRVMLLYKQGVREIRRLIHPTAWLPVKIGNQTESPRVIDAVWGFFGLYMVSFFAIMLLMMEAGLDEISAFSGVAACLNNVGPAMGEVATSFQGTSDPVKWLACLAMLLGRLEVFTLLVLFMPEYWRT